MYCSRKFGQLIVTKIIEIVAIRCQILRPKASNSISTGALLSTLRTSIPLFSRIFLNQPWHVCIQEVFHSAVLAKLVYASAASSGFCSASDGDKLEKFLNRCKRLNYCNQTTPCITEQFDGKTFRESPNLSSTL